MIHVAIVLSHKKGMLYFYRSFTQILTVAERVGWVKLTTAVLYHRFFFVLLLFGSLYYNFWYYLELLLFATLNLLHVENNYTKRYI